MIDSYPFNVTAQSRLEVEQLLTFIDTGKIELTLIASDCEKAVQASKAEAEAKSAPIRVAIAEAETKVQNYYKVHRNDAAVQIPAPGEAAGLDALTAQAAVVLMSQARTLTARQKEVLQAMAEGKVLRRINNWRSYSLIAPDKPTRTIFFLTTPQVFDLQLQYLDAFDLKTGERLLGASAYGSRPLEFRLKPDVVLP